MASQYDFKNREHQISSLEKEFDKFESSFNNTVKPILSIRFNENEYGERAIEKRLNSIINDSQKRITRKYNEYINSIRRCSYNSIENIKREANSAAAFVDSLNKSLEALNTINTAFSAKDFQKVISATIPTDYFNSEVLKYVLLLKIESYDAICNSELSSITQENYSDYVKYFSLCVQSNAKKHLLNAGRMVFIASYDLVSNRKANETEIYDSCKHGLIGYGILSEDIKSSHQEQYFKLYSIAITHFNEKCKKAYNAFEYDEVKSLLNDAKLFNVADIENAFFRDSSITAQKMFDYAKEFSHSASQQTMELVYEDTKELANGNSLYDYLSFWICKYDNYGNSFIDRIAQSQDDRYAYIPVLCSALTDNQSSVDGYGNCFLNSVEEYHNYLLENKDSIPLYKLVKASIQWNQAVKNSSHIYEEEDKLHFNQAVSILDGISYSMIVKYQSICSNFDADTIKGLNIVLDDASNRLLGKPYKKDIRKSENENKDNCFETTVKLVTFHMQQKKKLKWLLWSAITVGTVAIVVLIILLIKLLGG